MATRRRNQDVDAYISRFPSSIRAILRRIRATIAAAAPEAEEVISYRMPAFRQHGILLYYAAFKAHIGLYPPVRGDARLMKALAPYRGPGGNLKFPLDRPVPYALIRRVAELRARQDASSRRAPRPRSR